MVHTIVAVTGSQHRCTIFHLLCAVGKYDGKGWVIANSHTISMSTSRNRRQLLQNFFNVGLFPMYTNGTLPPSGGENKDATTQAYELRKREDTAVEQAIVEMATTSLDDIFSAEWLCGFHRNMFQGIHSHAGEFRNESIRVSWHIPHAYTRRHVEEQVEQYTADSRKRLALALLRQEALPALLGFTFWKFVYIAPFLDGNGRVANGLSILLQRKFGLPGVPLYNRLHTPEYTKFVEALRSYDTGNAAPFFEHLQEKLKLEA